MTLRRLTLTTLALVGAFLASLACAGLIVRALVGLTRNYGDYITDADPAIQRGLDGHLFSLWGTGDVTPLMWPFAILARLPFVAVGEALDLGRLLIGDPRLQELRRPEVFERLAYGSTGLLAISGFAVAVSAYLATGAWRQRWRVVMAAACGLVLMANPLTLLALGWGHPEEVLMAGLIGSALLLIIAGRYTTAAIAVGLAVATKQPALLIVPALVLMMPRGHRVRLLGIGAGTALLAGLPWVAGSFGEFVRQNQLVTTSGVGESGGRSVSLWGVLGSPTAPLAHHSHWILLAAILVATVLVGRRHGWQIPVVNGVALCVAILSARLFLDSYNISYYAVPLVAGVIALELGLGGRRWRGAPLGALALGLLLPVLSDYQWGPYEWLIGQMSATLVDTLFVIVTLAVATFGVIVAMRREPLSSWGQAFAFVRGRSRASLYGFAGFGVAIVLILSVGASGTPPAHLEALDGFKEVNVAEAAEQPTDVYWIGEAPTLQFIDMMIERPADATRPEVAVHYAGKDPSQTLLTIANDGRREKADKVAESIRACQSGSCPDGRHLVDTPLGPGVYSGSDADWAIRTVSPDGGEAVLIFGTGVGPASKIIPRIELLR